MEIHAPTKQNKRNEYGEGFLLAGGIIYLRVLQLIREISNMTRYKVMCKSQNYTVMTNNSSK